MSVLTCKDKNKLKFGKKEIFLFLHLLLLMHNPGFLSYQINHAKKKEIAKYAQRTTIVHL
ncbi:MAG: hypothetical protein LBD03_00165 [Methanobrevibacter sp.]|nr:hypothetical protein [Candidatus Methanovirga procula]